MNRCERCDGTGKLTYRVEPSGASVSTPEGVTITDAGGSRSRACPCVRDLPAIDGQATWWEMETLHRQVVPVAVGDESVDVVAECEVPRRADGRRVHRTIENAYYPALLRVETLREQLTLTVGDARELAAALTAAADACDRAGQPISGPGAK